MAAVTICSDFGDPQNKVWHCFHCFSVYLPWSDGTRCHDLIFLKSWALSHLFHSPLSLSSRDVRSCIRHYWQNGGMDPNPLSLSRRPGMKGLALMILTCFFLSSVELVGKNIKVLIVLERSMRNHKAFCSCAQKIIHKVNHWHLFKDLYKECPRMSM